MSRRQDRPVLDPLARAVALLRQLLTWLRSPVFGGRCL
jgi:hypothetical protein